MPGRLPTGVERPIGWPDRSGDLDVSTLHLLVLEHILGMPPEQQVSGATIRYSQDEEAVLQALETSESTYQRWRSQYGGMKPAEAVRLKKLEEENQRLKEVVAELTLDNRMLKHIAEGNW